MAISHVPDNASVLTYSKAKGLKRCPRAIKRTYIDRASVPASAPLERGIAAHEWIEEIGRLLVTPGADVSEEEMYKMLLIRAALLDDEPAADLRDIGYRMIASGAIPPIPDAAEDVAFERSWAIDVDGNTCGWDDPNCLVRSIYDQVFTEHNRTVGVIRDWKTSRKMDVDDFQVRLYAWAFAIHVPTLTEVIGEVHFVRFGKKGVRRVEFDSFGLDRLKSEMLTELHALRSDLERRIRDDEWEPRISDDCRWCSHRSSCPPFLDEVKPLTIIDSHEAALEAANQLVVLSGQRLEIEAALKGYVEANGTIDLGNGDEIGFVASARESIESPRKAARLLRKHVDDDTIWEHLKLPKAGLMKIVRAATADVRRGEKRVAQDAILDQLREKELFVEKPSSTFKRRKITEADHDED